MKEGTQVKVIHNDYNLHRFKVNEVISFTGDIDEGSSSQSYYFTNGEFRQWLSEDEFELVEQTVSNTYFDKYKLDAQDLLDNFFMIKGDDDFVESLINRVKMLEELKDGLEESLADANSQIAYYASLDD